MERSASNPSRPNGIKSSQPEPEPLEKRYGVIGCAAVKAATLLSRRKDDKKRSKGFASQGSR